MQFSGWNLLFSVLFLVLYALIVLVASGTAHGRRWWLLSTAAAAALIAGTFSAGWLRLILIDLAAFLTVPLVLDAGSEQSKHAARIYLPVLAAAVVMIAAAYGLTGGFTVEPAGWQRSLAAGLLIAGFALKLALIPLYFWLPAVAEAVPPMTLAVIISLVDIAAFNELIEAREAAPWVFTEHLPIWIGLAVLSMVGGALLALAQRDLKRMLAFSTIDDLGYLLLGVAAGSTGLEGARLGLISHAGMKVLLLGALAVVEYRLAHPVTLADRGLAARFPISAAAFIIGALGMIGVPPTLGFVGRWRLYLAGMEWSPWLLAVMLFATAAALFYYVRAVHTVWLGSPSDEKLSREPGRAAWALALLAVGVVAAGIYPGLWTALLP